MNSFFFWINFSELFFSPREARANGGFLVTIFADILIEESGLGRVRSEHGRTVTKRLVKFLQRFNVVFSNVQHGVYHSVALTKHPAHCPAGHFFFFFLSLSSRLCTASLGCLDIGGEFIKAQCEGGMQ